MSHVKIWPSATVSLSLVWENTFVASVEINSIPFTRWLHFTLPQGLSSECVKLSSLPDGERFVSFKASCENTNPAWSSRTHDQFFIQIVSLFLSFTAHCLFSSSKPMCLWLNSPQTFVFMSHVDPLWSNFSLPVSVKSQPVWVLQSSLRLTSAFQQTCADTQYSLRFRHCSFILWRT